MTRLFIIFLFPLAAILGGCGVGGGHTYTENDKDLVIEDFDSIKVGMDEAEVVEKMGLPISYGIDNEGRDFLHYAEINSASVSGVVFLPGFTGAATTEVIQGFEGFIYFDDNGKVYDIHVKEYQE